MKRILKYADLLFNIVVITILFLGSLILLIPFIPVWIGIIAYFEKPVMERELSDVFFTIKNNLKIILKLTTLLLVMTLISLLNILYFKNPQGLIQIIVLGASWILLLFSFITIIFSPIIIIQMNVNVKQVVFNSLALVMGGLLRYLIAIALCYLYIYFAIKYPVILVIGAYFIPYAIHYLSLTNINNLKNKGGKNV